MSATQSDSLDAITNSIATAPLAARPTPTLASTTAGTDSVATDLRVLHVVNGEFFAGAERVQMHLGRRLPNYGVRADFACLKQGRFSERFDLSGSDCQVFPMRNRFDVSVVGQIARQIGTRNYDLLHAHTPRSAMITCLLAQRLKLPWIYHVHSPTANDSERPLRNRINSWIERAAIRSAARYITVSNSLRSHMISAGYDANRIVVVHNGVPVERPLRVQKPQPGTPWTIGMVALMRPRKGLEVLVDALAILRDQGYPLTVRCIGPFETDAYETAIRQRVTDRGVLEAIDFVGFTKDIPSELAKIDALILPSLYGEGLPMVVLEAMAAGLPVVATRVEGTPEAIEDGVEGLLALPNSPHSLAEQIASLMDGVYDWQTMADAAAHRHAAQFSDMAMAKATAQVYRSVVPVPSATRI